MQVADRSYYNDSRGCTGPPRLLIKRTLSGTGGVYASGRRFLIPAGRAMFIERPGENIYCHKCAASWITPNRPRRLLG
jgi:hypothetical protein